MVRHLMIGIAALALCALRSSDAPDGKTFTTWQAFYTAAAAELDMDQTSADIFALAAESKQTMNSSDVTFILIKANRYRWDGDRPDNSLRGASGNGPYFLVKKVRGGFRFVGTMQGNGCDAQGQAMHGLAAVVLYTCTWHMSASSFTETRYESDGRALKLISTEERHAPP